MTLFEIIRLIVLGLAIAAPIGPISVHCMRTTIRSGLVAGIFAGLGAALADALVCLAAMSGADNFAGISNSMRQIINYLAFLFLLWLAAETMKTGDFNNHGESADSAGNSFLATFFYTALNPITLLTFLALFCGANRSSNPFEYMVLTSSCIFVGSALWWLALAYTLSFARAAISPSARRWINIGSSVCILTFAIKVLVGA